MGEGDDHSKCYTLVILLIAFTCIVLGLDVLIAGKSVGGALVCILIPIVLMLVTFIFTSDSKESVGVKLEKSWCHNNGSSTHGFAAWCGWIGCVYVWV